MNLPPAAPRIHHVVARGSVRCRHEQDVTPLHPCFIVEDERPVSVPGNGAAEERHLPIAAQHLAGNHPSACIAHAHRKVAVVAVDEARAPQCGDQVAELGNPFNGVNFSCVHGFEYGAPHIPGTSVSDARLFSRAAVRV